MRTPERQIGKKQVVIDDHDACRLRFALHPGDEAAPVVGACLPDARLARAADFAEEGVVFRNAVDAGQVARLRRSRPPFDDRERPSDAWLGRVGARLVLAIAAQTKVVGEPFDERCTYLEAQGAPDQGDVFGEDLLLEGPRRRRNDDLFSAQNGGDQIGQRLAGSRSRFADEHAVFGKRPFDGIGNKKSLGDFR